MKKPSPYHGWLVIDKPLDWTSNDIVCKLRSLLKMKKIGHAGTLDPLASGVLPIALGEATKAINYLMDAEKQYVFTVTFGESRTTDDSEGEVLATTEVMPSYQDLEQALPQFVGKIKQVPPIFSAIKVNGERAYKLARKGEIDTLPPREVVVHALEIISYEEGKACFHVICGKGTYVRSLARDIAVSVGSLGYVSTLKRTKVGVFSEKNTISLDMLQEMVHNDELENAVLPIHGALDDIPVLKMASSHLRQLRQGQAIRLGSEHDIDPESKEIFQIIIDHKIAAFAKLENGFIKPIRVFNI